jgi:lactate permease
VRRTIAFDPNASEDYAYWQTEDLLVVGKLTSPQNLAIAATAVGMDGQESVILRKAVGWSLGMLLVLCALVYLQSTPVPGSMLP